MEGMMGVQVDRVQAHGILDVIPHQRYLQIAHRTRGVQIDELALVRHGRDLYQGHAFGVFGAVEIGGVGVVGELDLQCEQLSWLIMAEIHFDVADMGIQIREFHLVIHGGEAEDIVLALVEVYLALQVDGIEARRSVEVDVEYHGLQEECYGQHHRDASQDMLDGGFIQLVEAPQMVCDVLP